MSFKSALEVLLESISFVIIVLPSRSSFIVLYVIIFITYGVDDVFALRVSVPAEN